MAADVSKLYVRYGPLVLRRCRALLRHDAAAQDALQDVFVQALRAQATLRPDTGAAYFHRLATNACLNRLRGARRKPEDHDDALVLAIAADLDLEARAHAQSALKRLFADEPETTATVAVLHYLDGMTWDEVATELGLSVSGVRKRARRITERLGVLQEERP